MTNRISENSTINKDFGHVTIMLLLLLLQTWAIGGNCYCTQAQRMIENT